MMTEAQLLTTVTERSLAISQPLKVILFGSRGRGEGRPDSDVDILVVLPQVDDKRLAAVEMRRALRDLPVGKDILVTTPDEIAKRGPLPGTVLREALEQGRVLFERTGCDKG